MKENWIHCKKEKFNKNKHKNVSRSHHIRSINVKEKCINLLLVT